MGIIHTAKKYIIEELLEKLIERQTFLEGRSLTEFEKKKLEIIADSEAKTMNLNQVCLCFEAYQQIDGNHFQRICDPVLSSPINNMSKFYNKHISETFLTRN